MIQISNKYQNTLLSHSNQYFRLYLTLVKMKMTSGKTTVLEKWGMIMVKRLFRDMFEVSFHTWLKTVVRQKTSRNICIQFVKAIKTF